MKLLTKSGSEGTSKTRSSSWVDIIFLATRKKKYDELVGVSVVRWRICMLQNEFFPLAPGSWRAGGGCVVPGNWTVGHLIGQFGVKGAADVAVEPT